MNEFYSEQSDEWFVHRTERISYVRQDFKKKEISQADLNRSINLGE